MATETTPAPAAEPVVIADPGPLGLAGFAMTTFVLSMINAGIFKDNITLVVLPLALFYGGIGQLLAGMWEFRKGNTFGALAFSSYGAFWLSFYWFVNYEAGAIGKGGGDVAKAEGLYLLAWTIFTAYMTLAAMKTNQLLLIIFVVLTLTFLFLTIGAFANSTGIHHVGGYLGILTALLAWYASAAGVTSATFKRPVLPTP